MYYSFVVAESRAARPRRHQSYARCHRRRHDPPSANSPGAFATASSHERHALFARARLDARVFSPACAHVSGMSLACLWHIVDVYRVRRGGQRFDGRRLK